MAELPAISVLMPAYNAARWLPASIASVLSQQGPSFELLVVDDGSSDDTPRVLAALTDPRVRVLRQPENRGLIAALNRGLAEARAPLVARLDADDACLPGRLARQHAALLADPEAVMVTGYSRLTADDGRELGFSRWRFSPEAYYYLLHFRNCIAHSTVLFRREAALAAGGYRASYKLAEDFELWGRLSRAGKIVSVESDVIDYRVHAASVSVSNQTAQHQMAARIASERLAPLLGESVEPALANLYSERAFARDLGGDLKRAARQFAAAQAQLWATRPRYCREPLLRAFMEVEWSRRAVSFLRRGVIPPRARYGGAPARPSPEGGVRGLCDELRSQRLFALLPQTHP